MFNNEQLKSILTEGKIISAEDFEALEKEARSSNKSLETFLLEDKRLLSSAELYEKAAKHFDVPFVNLKEQTIRKDILLKIPEPIAMAHNLIAFDGDEKEIKIAALDPDDLEIFEFIKKKLGAELKINLTTPDNIKEGLKQYHEALKNELGSFSGLIEGDEKIRFQAETEEGKSLERLAKDLPIVKIVNDLLEYAMFKDASDIHIEPEEKDVIVRYRIDGILYPVMTLDKNTQSGIIARIKILSDLKVDEHRLPQDGRFKFNSEKYQVSFRVSVIPTFDGEKIVIRILDERAQILSLESLGLQPKSLEMLKRNITKPHGMILVTGPTGSGKTTTLYTVLNILNTPKVNISTIEDPIEYRMPHVNQSQTNSKIGFTFGSGLRALLRQDPNIIMVGEIRDQETAEIAVNAALTGHLLLSTLHTNDAITALPRLAQMGIPSFLIASTTNLIMSQRLVRRLCPYCRVSYNLTKKATEELEKQLDLSGLLNKLEKQGMIDSKEEIETFTFYRHKGCNKCNDSGYKGRIGVYETMEMTPALSDLILKNADTGELRKEAEKQGMVSLIEDGLLKAIAGITTLEEVLRVTKE